jgi:hypothetical protein
MLVRRISYLATTARWCDYGTSAARAITGPGSDVFESLSRVPCTVGSAMARMEMAERRLDTAENRCC